MTASHAATSTRLSSTLRSTSCALRTMTVSFPSAITVLSPVVAVLGTAAAPLVSAALGAGDGAPAWRDVSAKVTVPILESEHAASTISGASAISFAVFILPPHRGGQGARRCSAGRLASDVPSAMRAATARRRTKCERSHMCSRHVRLSLHQSGAATPAISQEDRKSTRLNSSHPSISYAVFCLKKKKTSL